jgi:hypothetical protein
VDDQITSKKLKKKMEVHQSPTRELRIYNKRKTCKKKKKTEERLSAKLICFCTRDSIKETTYKKKKKKKR